eukprot:TCONS_00007448-protein
MNSKMNNKTTKINKENVTNENEGDMTTPYISLNGLLLKPKQKSSTPHHASLNRAFAERLRLLLSDGKQSMGTSDVRYPSNVPRKANLLPPTMARNIIINNPKKSVPEKLKTFGSVQNVARYQPITITRKDQLSSETSNLLIETPKKLVTGQLGTPQNQAQSPRIVSQKENLSPTGVTNALVEKFKRSSIPEELRILERNQNEAENTVNTSCKAKLLPYTACNIQDKTKRKSVSGELTLRNVRNETAQHICNVNREDFIRTSKILIEKSDMNVITDQVSTNQHTIENKDDLYFDPTGFGDSVNLWGFVGDCRESDSKHLESQNETFVDPNMEIKIELDLDSEMEPLINDIDSIQEAENINNNAGFDKLKQGENEFITKPNLDMKAELIPGVKSREGENISSKTSIVKRLQSDCQTYEYGIIPGSDIWNVDEDREFVTSDIGNIMIIPNDENIDSRGTVTISQQVDFSGGYPDHVIFPNDTNDKGNSDQNSFNTEIQVVPIPPRRVPKQRELMECDVCGMKFAIKELLKNHKKLHQNTEPFGCKDCGKLFKKEINLTKHINSVHKNRIQCDVCGQSMSSLGYLKRHQIIHISVECKVCGKLCANQFKLKEHQVIHNAKAFQCDVCGNSFTQKAYLSKHKDMVHKGIKPFKCNACGKYFAQRGDLRVHIAAKHKQEKDFKCYECGKMFPLKRYLKCHMERIHEGVAQRRKRRNLSSVTVLPKHPLNQDFSNSGANP